MFCVAEGREEIRSAVGNVEPPSYRQNLLALRVQLAQLLSSKVFALFVEVADAYRATHRTKNKN